MKKGQEFTNDSLSTSDSLSTFMQKWSVNSSTIVFIEFVKKKERISLNKMKASRLFGVLLLLTEITRGI